MGVRILTLVECKHLKRSVEAGDVEEFYAKLRDIGGHKGIVLDDGWLSGGRPKVAEAYEIALLKIQTVTEDSR